MVRRAIVCLLVAQYLALIEPATTSAAEPPKSTAAKENGNAASLPNHTGFPDGDLTKLDDMTNKLQAASHAPRTGIPFIDEALNQLQDPRGQLHIFWSTTGNVTFSKASGTPMLELRHASSGDTSLGHQVLLPLRAQNLEFDMQHRDSAPNDTLDVVFTGERPARATILQHYELAAIPANNHITLPLSSIPGVTEDHFPLEGPIGVFEWRLKGPTSSQVVVSLGHFKITAASGNPPLLTPTHPVLPTISATDNDDRGIAVPRLCAGIPQQESIGIVLVGANTLHGKLQFNLGDHVHWIDINALSEAHAFLMVNNPYVRIRFVADPGFTGTIDNVLTFRAWDRAATPRAYPFQYVDATAAGDATPFSAASDSASITVTGTVPPGGH